MKKIQLTQNKFTIVDDEDYGELNKRNWYANLNRSVKTYYAVRKDYQLNKKNIHMHRVIMNCPKDKFIDHINGNTLDNRKENLRICTGTQNQGNMKIHKDNASGIKGITWDKSRKKWKAQISINNKSKHLGLFSDKLKAKAAYTKAAKQYFGEFYSDGIKKENVNLINKMNSIKLIKEKRINSNNTSGIKGVGYHKRDKKWFSSISINGKRTYLGYYFCIADAKAAYDVAAGNI